MKLESYETTQDPKDVTVFEFISTGPNGSIPKRIRFCPTANKDVFELAFGNVLSEQDIDVMAVSDNGDRDKILATIALSIEVFLTDFPNRIVYFRGSTSSRTRLYKVAISLNLFELEKKYVILGVYGNQPLPFQKNLSASAFYVKKRT